MIGTPLRKPAFSIQKQAEDEQATENERKTRKLCLTIRKERQPAQIPLLQLSAKHMEQDILEGPSYYPLNFSRLSWSKEILLTNEFANLFNCRNQGIRRLFDENATVITGPEFKCESFAHGLGVLAAWVLSIELLAGARLFAPVRPLGEIVVSRTGNFHTVDTSAAISLSFCIDIARGVIKELRSTFSAIERPSNLM